MFDVTLVTTRHQIACGPACLKMLLAYYGTDVDLDTLITECGVSVNGCTAADVLRVGRAHGLTAMAAYREGSDAVLRQDRPAILYWRHQHFVVYAGLNDAGEPVICNPGQGRYAIDVGSFNALYSGIALCNGRPADQFPADYFGENEPEPDYFNN